MADSEVKPKEKPPRSLSIAKIAFPEELEILAGSVLGEGSQGMVYEALWKPKTDKLQRTFRVAAKKLQKFDEIQVSVLTTHVHTYNSLAGSIRLLSWYLSRT